MATAAATKDGLFDTLVNIHQLVSDCGGTRTEQVECLDSITEEILGVIPDADSYLEAAGDTDDQDENEIGNEEEES